MARSLVTRTAAALCGVVAVIGLLATPAQAFHVGMIARDGSRCSLGDWALGLSGPGVRLVTEKAALEIDPLSRDMAYTCHFVVPSYVAPQDHAFGREWFLPDRAVKFDVTCWPPTYPREVLQSTEASFLVTPSGKGILHCYYANFMSRTQDPLFPN